jgi:hypothetical protein
MTVKVNSVVAMIVSRSVAAMDGEGQYVPAVRVSFSRRIYTFH